MLEKYSSLFDRYLQICRSMYDPEKPYDNLEKCIRFCDSFEERLKGMVSLLEEAEVITREEAGREVSRIIESFSSVSICNAYITNGEVRVFGEKGGI